MSLDHLKKQAKNAQVLLKEFGVPGEVQLHDSQRFVARLRGFPNWLAACVTQSASGNPRALTAP
ncbi:hypothetical protein [Burkholderia ambifaria]|uniref:hypothetical protein n=1 Tax=Burkholderia ambifaria TaxID=152480 RepID=UPI000F81060C|nr:hypothetical protein [Burkholderia ambifaria]